MLQKTLHSELVNKPLDLSKRKTQETPWSASIFHKNVTINNAAQLASCMVLCTAALKQPGTTAEKLILPTAIYAVSTLTDGEKKSAEKLKCFPLSNNTVSCRINDISGNLEERLITRLKAAGDFFIRLDENTDISACASLLAYIQYRWENESAEDLICCLTIPTSLTGEEIFDALNKYMVTKCGLELEQL